MTAFSKDWPELTVEERQVAREKPWELSEDGSCWVTGEGYLIGILQPPPLTRSDPIKLPDRITAVVEEDPEYDIMDGCVCPGGWQNCLQRGCPACWGADTYEEPPPCDLEAEGY